MLTCGGSRPAIRSINRVVVFVVMVRNRDYRSFFNILDMIQRTSSSDERRSNRKHNLHHSTDSFFFKLNVHDDVLNMYSVSLRTEDALLQTVWVFLINCCRLQPPSGLRHDDKTLRSELLHQTEGSFAPGVEKLPPESLRGGWPYGASDPCRLKTESGLERCWISDACCPWRNAVASFGDKFTPEIRIDYLVSVLCSPRSSVVWDEERMWVFSVYAPFRGERLGLAAWPK